ncbi:hypothetical protein AURDEDRAFT_127609 [Auricularia subglabra TFB-10046 SS5]|nr:hypothetical protein AURDEDRAFT_127609 [Auricularia subglabra TFB-10046 SS5]
MQSGRERVDARELAEIDIAALHERILRHGIRECVRRSLTMQVYVALQYEPDPSGRENIASPGNTREELSAKLDGKSNQAYECKYPKVRPQKYPKVGYSWTPQTGWAVKQQSMTFRNGRRSLSHFLVPQQGSRELRTQQPSVADNVAWKKRIKKRIKKRMRGS